MNYKNKVTAILTKILTKDLVKNHSFGSEKLTKNSDPDKYRFISQGLRFNSSFEFSFKDRMMRKNFITFGTSVNLSKIFIIKITMS